jgi:hypothetical protein
MTKKALKMDAANSSETMVHIYQFTSCHIQENQNLNTHCCENLVSHNLKLPVAGPSGHQILKFANYFVETHDFLFDQVKEF